MLLSDDLKRYLEAYQRDYDYRHQGIIASFEVDDLALSVGKFYEQIRKVVDWKEENALRRGAISRAIKRNLVANVYSFTRDDLGRLHHMAEGMVLELMRSGYFDNNFINTQKVKTVAQILQKYLIILQDLNTVNRDVSQTDLKSKIKLQTWTIEVAACELEECLMPPFKTTALINLMSGVLERRIKIIPQETLSNHEREIFLQIGVWRSLFGADDYLLSYLLLKRTQSNFFDFSHEFGRAQVCAYINQYQIIENYLNHKVARLFLRICNKYDAAYRLIGLIANQAEITSVSLGEDFFSHETQVQEAYETIYKQRIKNLKISLLKAAFWTTLSILIANIASVLILELPVAGLLGYDFSWWAIFWDIMIPSIAMFALVMLIRPPRKENQAVVWEEISKILYQDKQQDVYEIRLNQKSSLILQGFFTGTTILAGAVGLLGIGALFYLAGLPITSVYLNVVYITMVLFASLNIRAKAQALTIYERTGLSDFLLDIFALPLARIGQWFSKKWKEYNIFSIVFSIIIDVPFSLLIAFIEEWRGFLKETKSEIR